MNDDGIAYGETVPFRPEHPDYVILEDAGLMVQKTDLGAINWSSANILCQGSTIGGFNDWRLPTKDELSVLYNNRDLIGGFSDAYYWSSTFVYTDDRNFDYYYSMNFIDGFIISRDGSYSGCVRAVRSLP